MGASKSDNVADSQDHAKEDRSMCHAETLISLIEGEKPVTMLTFLRSLGMEERATLTPTILALRSRYFVAADPSDADVYADLPQAIAFVLLVHNHSVSIRCVGTLRQHKMILIAAFVCMSRREYDRIINGILADVFKEDILAWYVPTWFSDYINEPEHFFTAYSYPMLLQHIERGQVQASDALLANKLVRGLEIDFEKCTLILHDDHLPALFRAESTLIFHPENWQRIFARLIKIGKISRIDVLQRALQSSMYFTNRDFIRFYFDLFMHLEPTREELLHLQDDLFVVLSSPPTPKRSTSVSNV